MVNPLNNKYYHNYNIERKYRNFPPKIIIDDQYRNIRFYLDRELKILKLQIPEDNIANREWCYWAESTCQTHTKWTHAAMVGKGLRVKCETNKRAEEIVHRFNKKVNSSGQSMEDLLYHGLIDNDIHGFSVWRILRLPEEPYVDLGRLDVSKVMPWHDDQHGWLKFIYRTVLDPTAPKTKKKFLSATYAPVWDEQTKEPMDGGNMYEWHIPVESTLYLNLVSRPPMSAALQYVIFKRWILWFMRKCAEKAWMPPIIGTLGNKEKEFQYLSDGDQDRQMRAYAKQLARLASFGVMVKIYGEEVETLSDKSSVQQRMGFVEQIRLLDEQILFAMGGSMGFSSPNSGKVENREEGNMAIRVIQANRRRIATQLENFYVKILLPEFGINLKEGELSMDWSHLKEDRNLETVQMAIESWESGALKPEWVLQALSTAWDWIDPKDAEALKWMKEAWKKINETPTQFGGSQAQRSMKKSTQATRPMTQKKGATQKR